MKMSKTEFSLRYLYLLSLTENQRQPYILLTELLRMAVVLNTVTTTTTAVITKSQDWLSPL